MKESVRPGIPIRLRQTVFGLLGLVETPPLIIRADQLRRAIMRSDRRLRDEYLRRTTKPKLHIGSGFRLLQGWLNTDIQTIPHVMQMDATQPFPLAEHTFQYVYTEHMIEHVSYENGVLMLRECHRVMRDGGVIRVSTPNLAAILGLYLEGLCPEQQEYLQWFCGTFVPEHQPDAVSAINAMFRQWGHQFLYDEKTLADAMRTAGFKAIQRRTLGESSHIELRNIENEQRYPKGLLNFESLALEGLK